LRRSFAETWEKVQLPERQKMEIFRGAELFEAGDRAAASGLLLSAHQERESRS
jgi:hypothetical protein